MDFFIVSIFCYDCALEGQPEWAATYKEQLGKTKPTLYKKMQYYQHSLLDIRFNHALLCISGA